MTGDELVESLLNGIVSEFGDQEGINYAYRRRRRATGNAVNIWAVLFSRFNLQQKANHAVNWVLIDYRRFHCFRRIPFMDGKNIRSRA